MKHKIYVISVYTIYRLVAVSPAHMTSSTRSYEVAVYYFGALSTNRHIYIAFLTAVLTYLCQTMKYMLKTEKKELLSEMYPWKRKDVRKLYGKTEKY